MGGVFHMHIGPGSDRPHPHASKAEEKQNAKKKKKKEQLKNRWPRLENSWQSFQQLHWWRKKNVPNLLDF